MAGIDHRHGAPLSVAGAHVLDVGIDGGRRRSVRCVAVYHALVVVVAAGQLPLAEHLDFDVLIVEVGNKGQLVAGCKGQRVVVIYLRAVIVAILPALGRQRAGPILGLTLREDVHVDQTDVVQLRGRVVLAHQVVVEAELRRDTVGLLVAPGLFGYGDRVTQTADGRQLSRRCSCQRRTDIVRGTLRQHDIEFIGVVAVGILTIDGHVGRQLLRTAQNVVIVVAQVGRIGQREGGAERDAVRHEVVECQFRGEAVELLLDDGTRLVVVTGRDAEVGLLATTGKRQVVVLAPAGLLHLLHPVGVVVPVLELSPRAVVVDLVDVGRCRGALGGVVVHLLQHHGVVVTVQQVVTLGLPRGLNTQGVVHTGGTAGTTLRANLNHTVSTA